MAADRPRQYAVSRTSRWSALNATGLPEGDEAGSSARGADDQRHPWRDLNDISTLRKRAPPPIAPPPALSTLVQIRGKLEAQACAEHEARSNERNAREDTPVDAHFGAAVGGRGGPPRPGSIAETRPKHRRQATSRSVTSCATRSAAGAAPRERQFVGAPPPAPAGVGDVGAMRSPDRPRPRGSASPGVADQLLGLRMATPFCRWWPDMPVRDGPPAPTSLAPASARRRP